jgi:hypothetical protein
MPPEPVILHGWTEIRRWMGGRGVHVHVRTLQDWRSHHALPVITVEFMREVIAEPCLLEEWLRREVLRRGGRFLFTMQTGHVDLEMVNEVFRGFDGRPLKITVRPARLLHGWARRVGLHVERSLCDEWHYHAVTLARKH